MISLCRSLRERVVTNLIVISLEWTVKLKWLDIRKINWKRGVESTVVRRRAKRFAKPIANGVPDV